MELNNEQFSQYREAWMLRHRSWIPNQAHYKAVHSYGKWVTFFVFAVFFAAGSIQYLFCALKANTINGFKQMI